MKRSEILAGELEALRQEIVELAAVEEPTDEQVERMDALLPLVDEKQSEYDTEIARDEKIEGIKRAAENPKNVTPGVFTVPEVMVRRDPVENLDAVARGWIPADEMVSRAATLIENSKVGEDSAKQRATVLAESNPDIARRALLVGSDAYRRAFLQVLRHPENAAVVLDEEERYALRAAMSNTDANGGYSIPFLLDPTVILTNDGIAGSIRSIARVETGMSDYWNGLTSAGVTAEWLTEASEAADASPTFAQPSIKAEKAAAYLAMSFEQQADGQLVSQLPGLIADAKNRLDEAAFATGSGTNQPKGIITAVAAVTASRVSPTTGGTFTTASRADVDKVLEAVPPRHRSRSAWIANYSTYGIIRRMDTSGGSSFWVNLGGGQPQQLLGQPIYENSTMTATVTTGSNLLLAGDFSEYLIFDRVGMEVRFNPLVIGSSQRPTGQVGWFATWRTGAGCLNANAFRLLQL